MIGFGKCIDAEKMVKLRDSHLLGIAINKSTTTHHIMVVKPLRRISLKVHVLCSFLNLASSCAVLPEIIIIGGSHDVELSQSIMETVLLALSKGALLGEDTAETFLGTKTSIEERLASPDTLHHLH